MKLLVISALVASVCAAKGAGSRLHHMLDEFDEEDHMGRGHSFLNKDTVKQHAHSILKDVLPEEDHPELHEIVGDEHLLHTHPGHPLDEDHDHAAEVYDKGHHEHMETMATVMQYKDKLEPDKHAELMSALMKVRESTVRGKPGDHPDDYKYHAIQKKKRSEHKQMEALHGHDQELMREKRNALNEVHDKKYGTITKEYQERFKEKQEAERLLREAKAAAIRAEREAYEAQVAAQKAAKDAEEEFVPLEPTIDLGGDGDAMHRLDDILERDGLLDDPEIRKALDEADIEVNKLSKSNQSTRLVLTIVSSVLLVTLCLVGAMFYAISDGKEGNYKVEQARKAASQTRIGQGIRVRND